MTDNTTILPNNGTPGFFHSDGGHHGHNNLLGELILSERVSNANSFTLAGVERANHAVRDDVKDVILQNGATQREFAKELGDIKALIVEKAHENRDLMRSIEAERLRDNLSEARLRIARLEAAA